MIRVIVAEGKYSASFDTLEEAEAWASKHKFNDGTNVEFIEDDPSDIKPFWNALSKRRKELLLETDWSQLPDCELPTQDRLHYRKYRKYVRDIKSQYDNKSIQRWDIKSFEEFIKWKSLK